MAGKSMNILFENYAPLIWECGVWDAARVCPCQNSQFIIYSHVKSHSTLCSIVKFLKHTIVSISQSEGSADI